jgi:hypothetical protein
MATGTTPSNREAANCKGYFFALPKIEREAAEFLAAHLKGIGPKQSRNLLRALGLSRYEVPIDSRVMRWLNDFGFPIELSATSLSVPKYFNLVSDVFQRLARSGGLRPCVLDATTFASFQRQRDGTRPHGVFAVVISCEQRKPASLDDLIDHRGRRIPRATWSDLEEIETQRRRNLGSPFSEKPIPETAPSTEPARVPIPGVGNTTSGTMTAAGRPTVRTRATEASPLATGHR